MAGLSARDRRVAARTQSGPPSRLPPGPAPASAPAEAGPRRRHRRGQPLAEVIPMPIFDPFAETDKRW